MLGFGIGFGFDQNIENFNAMSTLFLVVVLLGIGSRLFLRYYKWSKNKVEPNLHVDAKVVSKRTEVRRRKTVGNQLNYHTSTIYFVTFEVSSGDRIELRVSNKQYGMIAQQDLGKLNYQGTRFLAFNRSN